jgi:hypothetical protein
MIDRSHQLPIKRQAELLAISRGSVYYHPEPVSQADLRLMRRIKSCIWSTRLRARGCCATSLTAKVCGWAGATWVR